MIVLVQGQNRDRDTANLKMPSLSRSNQLKYIPLAILRLLENNRTNIDNYLYEQWTTYIDATAAKRFDCIDIGKIILYKLSCFIHDLKN